MTSAAATTRAVMAAKTDEPNPRIEQIVRFVEVYRQTFSMSQAAIACGYSAHSAHSAGSRLLALPAVQEVLERATLDTLAESNVRTKDILDELSHLAYSNIVELFERGVEVKNGRYQIRMRALFDLPIRLQKAISSVKVVQRNLIAGDGVNDDVIEFKLWSKVEALKVLAQHRGLLREIVELQITTRQLEKMTDEQLIASRREATEKLERHHAAQARLRAHLAVVPETTGEQP